MITKFKKYYGYTRVIKIVNTYRNSIELINTANTFIIKNRYQIKKKLLSNKHLEKPIKIIYYKKNESIIFKKLLELISGNVLILGRNNFDVNYVLNDEITFKDNKIIYKKEYDYKTVHRSKGLEEDNIILINLNNSRYGFPNKKNDNITKVLLPKDRYLYEEERRLFYVALTRTKNYIYLLVDIDNPSTFVKELLRNSKKYIEVLDL
jgi:DNA helicase-4